MDDFNSLIADKHALTLLFDTQLYLLAEDKKATSAAEPIVSVAPYTLSGANTRGIVFIYRSREELAPAEQQLFSDIVTKGLKMSIDDVALVRFSPDYSLTINELKGKTSVNKIILWGLSPKDVGIDLLVPKYKVSEAEGITLLVADALDKVQREVSVKKELWSSLQKMF